MANPAWYVFYTKSRHEKKVRDHLEQRGWEVFLPMQTVMRQWTDRKKKVEVPLFNSYIFVRIVESSMLHILRAPGVSWAVRHNNKPAILRDVEYEMIQRVLSLGVYIETAPWERELIPGDRAEVIGGPLAGLEGVVTGTGNEQKIALLLESISHLLRVEIDPIFLKKIG